MILRSSCLAVAMEYLGLLESEEMKQYAASRGGMVFHYYTCEENPKRVIQATLTFRELLDLLPE